jgi:hypothetical protein
MAVTRRSVRFKFDLFQLVSAILISLVGPGVDIESNLAVDLVGVVSVCEDGNYFSLQLGAGRLGLRVFAAEDKVNDQRRRYRDK